MADQSRNRRGQEVHDQDFPDMSHLINTRSGPSKNEMPKISHPASKEKYSPVGHTIVANAVRLEPDSKAQIAHICKEVSNSFSTYAERDYMDADQQACWVDYQLYTRLFPGQNDFPGDKEPLKRWNMQLDARKQATGDPRGLSLFPDVPFASVLILARRTFATAKHLSEVDEENNANRSSQDEDCHLSKKDLLIQIHRNRGTPQPNTTHILPDIREDHKWKYNEQEVLLSMMRPHSGIYLDYLSPNHHDSVPDNPDEELLTTRSADVDTSGIDTLLVLLRFLITLDITFKPQTTAEKVFLQTAWKQLGWDRIEDWIAKADLVKNILGTDYVEEESSILSATFKELLDSPSLQRLIVDNDDLNMFNTHFAKHSPDFFPTPENPTRDWTWMVPRSSDSRELHELLPCWNNMTIQTHINDYFAQVDNQKHCVSYLAFAKTPRLIRVEYHVKTKNPVQKILELRTFNLQARTAWQKKNKWFQGVQDTQYLLRAVARLGYNGPNTKHHTQSDIRLYWESGEEITPPDLSGQDLVLTDNVQRGDGKMWSVEDVGHYMLFYQRVVSENGKIGEAEMEDIKAAAEFVPRSWVEKMRVRDDASSEDQENGNKRNFDESNAKSKESKEDQNIKKESSSPSRKMPRLEFEEDGFEQEI